MEKHLEFLKGYNVHYLMVNDQLYAVDGYQGKCDIRSISKTVMTILAGILNKEAGDQGFGAETYIWPILSKKYHLKNTANFAKLEKIQVKHLLNHTMGFDRVMMMRGDIKDMIPAEYVDYILNEPLVYEPGEKFLYSNAGFYILSVVMELYLKDSLEDYAQEKLFIPLGIVDWEWEKYGDYLAGATRLWLYPEDLAKIGDLLISAGEGFYTTQWNSLIHTPTTLTQYADRPELKLLRRYQYGHGIWLSNNEVYFGHGTDGQILALDPVTKTKVVVLSEEKNIGPIEEAVDLILSERR